ncbi:transcriptional regulator [Mycobacteroides abscessus subsp. massiliense]|nr:transcriptional regulator [Mycobacteroides abscessus subsp. massiliense]
MTQGGLGELVGLDRTAINRAERGDRKFAATEIIAIAEALGHPLAYFVNEPVAAAVSRRTDLAQRSDPTGAFHDTTRKQDREIELFGSDLRMLLEMGLIESVTRLPNVGTPQDHRAAEDLASKVRASAGLDDQPIPNLGQVCERLGMYTYAASFNVNGPDGGCVAVGTDQEDVAAAVINGDVGVGRRRMTLAHELGHWVCGDAYDRWLGDDTEKMINSFAIHFLAPRSGVCRIWNEHREWGQRDRALAVGAHYRLSWVATIGQLRNLDLISSDDFRILSEREPRGGDFVKLELAWNDEPKCPYLSPGFAAACVKGYTSGQLTLARTVELLRGTMTKDDLPEPLPRSLDSLRRSFAGHGD